MKPAATMNQPKGEAQFGLNARKVARARKLDLLLQLSIGRFVQSRLPQPPLASLEPHTILLLYPQLIGDVAIVTGFLRGLRRRYPNASVTVVGQRFLHDLLVKQGLYDSFVEFRCPWRAFDYSPRNLMAMLRVARDVRRQGWDLAIELRGDLRNIAFLKATGARYRVAPVITGGAYLLTHPLRPSTELRHLADSQRLVLEALGGTIQLPRLEVQTAERDWANSVVGKIAGTRRAVAIHPGTSRESKYWFPERFAQLAETIEARFAAAPILVLGPGDTALGESIVAKSQTRLHTVKPSLRQLPALLQRCDLLIGLDSASAHISGAVGTPCVVLFGPSDPLLARPLGSLSSIVIKDGFPCRPCGLGSCPLGTDRSCMAAISVEDVLVEIESFLAPSGAHDV